MARNNTALIIKRLLFLGVILIIIGYSIFNFRLFVSGPKITVDSPENGSTIYQDRLIDISGTASNISYIELDGGQIHVEEDGKFSETLLLDCGYNIIRITAKDKFKRVVENNLQLMFRSDECEEVGDGDVEEEFNENAFSELGEDEYSEESTEEEADEIEFVDGVSDILNNI